MHGNLIIVYYAMRFKVTGPESIAYAYNEIVLDINK